MPESIKRTFRTGEFFANFENHPVDRAFARVRTFLLVGRMVCDPHGSGCVPIQPEKGPCTVIPYSLTQPQPFRARRLSSYDRTGGNNDWIPIGGRSTCVIGDIRGPGIISHLYFTVNSPDPHYLRSLVLRCFWDDEPFPSVECPLGDFFCVGHGAVSTFENAAFSMAANKSKTYGRFAPMNCWVPMPFSERARLEITNDSDIPVIAFYFHIDYQEYEQLPGTPWYLHATWRRENPCDGWKGTGSVVWGPEWAARHQTEDDSNLTGSGNYVILETKGRGTYLGCNLSVDNLYKGWWGEGDDMIFVDGEVWPPSLHGTGTEEYFGQGWGMQDVQHQYYGLSYHEREDFNDRGKVTVYRFHVADPIPFSESIRVTLEHGHANDRSDDYASTAYWYQAEPHVPFAALPDVGARLPNP